MLPLVALLLALAFAGEARADMSKGFRRLLDAVVRIDVRELAFEEGARHFETSIGSGVIISEDGLVLTNAHVAGPRAVQILVTLASLERVGAQFVGWDHWTDLAVLRIDAAELKRRGLKLEKGEFGDSAKLFVGEELYAVGTPHGLSRTVTRGILSNANRYFEDSRAVRGYETGSFNTWLQTDAAINPGNSGGPLVTAAGKIVGINSRAYVGADNLGFAIPSNVARAIAEELVKRGSVTRSYTGIVPGAMQDLEQFYALGVNTGLLVNNVDVGSPAARAGLRGGDILLAIDGRKVDGRFPEQLPPIQHAIASRPVGSKLVLTVKRGAEQRQFEVVTEKLESRVGEEWVFESWGLGVRKVSRTFARENQLSDDSGMVVIGVRPGYPAQVAGISRGDIIRQIQRQPINGLDEARRIHGEFDAKPAPMLVETRRGRSASLNVLKP